MKIVKRLMVPALVLVLAGMALTGCKDKSASAAQDDPDKPFEMTIFAQCYLPEPPSSDQEVFRIIERETNTKLNVTWMIDMNTKISTTLASGADMPMVLYVPNIKEFNVINAIEAGAFWELSDYIPEFPEIAELYDPIRAVNAKVNGGNYGLLRKRPTTQYGVIYRKDWLDKVGLQPPETVDELFAMWKAFTEDDPDGNGKKDTYGLSMREMLEHYHIVTLLYGAPYRWKYEDGKMVPEFMTGEFYQGLDVFREAYARGYMNQDFAVLKASQMLDNINTGKAGSYIDLHSEAGAKHEALYKVNPKAFIDLLPCLSGPAGKKTKADPGVAGWFPITKKGVKDEAGVLKVMAFFNKLNEPYMQDLLRWGIKDKHYRLEDGVPVRPAEWNDAYIKEVNVFRSLKTHYDDKAMNGKLDYQYGKGRELNVADEPYGVPDPTFPLISQTYIEWGSELDIMINDAIVKYVMGELDRAGFDAVAQLWLTTGGQKVIEEYSAQYKQ
jgi:putative aldouronate transport system substrate-binding protein